MKVTLLSSSITSHYKVMCVMMNEGKKVICVMEVMEVMEVVEVIKVMKKLMNKVTEVTT